MGFDKRQFLSFILDNNVVGFFDEPVTLKSGRKSHWYVNWRAVSSDVYLTDKLSDFLLEFVLSLNIPHDGFYGVPEGATKLALVTQFKWASSRPDYKPHSHMLSMGRGKAKEHGSPRDRYFLGEPFGRVIVVEDVTTTGTSLISAVREVKEAGAVVACAIGLTNRMEKNDEGKSVEESAALHNVKYYAMTRADEILPEAFLRFKPRAEIVAAIEREFLEYGVKPIKLK